MNHTVGYRLFKICIVNYLRPKYLLGSVSIKGPDLYPGLSWHFSAAVYTDGQGWDVHMVIHHYNILLAFSGQFRISEVYTKICMCLS